MSTMQYLMDFQYYFVKKFYAIIQADNESQQNILTFCIQLVQ